MDTVTGNPDGSAGAGYLRESVGWSQYQGAATRFELKLNGGEKLLVSQANMRAENDLPDVFHCDRQRPGSNTQDFIEVGFRRCFRMRWWLFLSSNTQDFIEVLAQ